MRSHQSLVTELVPDIKLDHLGPYKKVFKLTKTIQLIIQDQYRHLVVTSPHQIFSLMSTLFQLTFAGYYSGVTRVVQQSFGPKYTADNLPSFSYSYIKFGPVGDMYWAVGGSDPGETLFKDILSHPDSH